MEDKNHKEFIKKHYIEYRKIGQVKCPAFHNEKIYFTKRGFRHLIYKNNDRRSNFDYRRRLELVKYAITIVSNSDEYCEYRKLISNTRTVHFWSLEKKMDGLDVVLIIKQMDDGEKQFFSIMCKK